MPTEILTRSAPLVPSTFRRDGAIAYVDATITTGAEVRRSFGAERLALTREAVTLPESVPLRDNHRSGSIRDILGQCDRLPLRAGRHRRDVGDPRRRGGRPGGARRRRRRVDRLRPDGVGGHPRGHPPGADANRVGAARSVLNRQTRRVRRNDQEQRHGADPRADPAPEPSRPRRRSSAPTSRRPAARTPPPPTRCARKPSTAAWPALSRARAPGSSWASASPSSAMTRWCAPATPGSAS